MLTAPKQLKVDFKFGMHALCDSPNRTPEKIFRKGGVARVMCPCKFLGVMCSKKVKAMEYGLQICVRSNEAYKGN